MMANLIKDHVARAKELETAIYTQKILQAKYEQLLNSTRPICPNETAIAAAPVAPVKPDDEAKNPMRTAAIAVTIFFLAFQLFVMSVGEWSSPAIPVVMVGICVILYLAAYSRSKENREIYDEAMEVYQQALTEYQQSLANYNQYKEWTVRAHQDAINSYMAELTAHNKMVAASMAPHIELLHTLENSLANHYAQNILFPKYRNWIAVSTIDEYLQSGRCEQLEGSTGAYNLYESELRQNRIIDKLTTIVDNLEQIRTNQYTLYQEVHKANSTVNEIMNEITALHSTAKLTAYFSSVSALAAVSPTIIHGHIY